MEERKAQFKFTRARLLGGSSNGKPARYSRGVHPDRAAFKTTSLRLTLLHAVEYTRLLEVREAKLTKMGVPFQADYC